MQVALMLTALPWWRKFPCFFMSLLVWLPVLWFQGAPHEVLEHRIWLPCALALIPLQGLAALEAFFSFAGRYRRAARLSLMLSACTVPFLVAFWQWPVGGTLEQVIWAARFESIFAVAFAFAAAGYFAAHDTRDALLSTEGTHALLFAVWMFTWAAAALAGPATTWEIRAAVTWPFASRSALLLVWLMMLRPTATAR
jgi:hypothetical protein